MSGTTGREAEGVRPKGIEAAWRLTLAAVAATAVDWVLGAFVIEPTGLGELTAHSGADAAARQLALSGGVLLVVLAGWLAVAVRMRAAAAGPVRSSVSRAAAVCCSWPPTSA